MNDSVESDAFVMPSSSGVPSAGSPPRAITFSFSSRKRKRSTCSSTRKSIVLLQEAETMGLLVHEEVGVPHSRHAHRTQHLTADDFDVLVVDGHRLRAVNLLDLVDQIPLQLLDAEDREHVVRIDGAIDQRIARP